MQCLFGSNSDLQNICTLFANRRVDEQIEYATIAIPTCKYNFFRLNLIYNIKLLTETGVEVSSNRCMV
jgi:hypothetical protein